MVFAAVSKAAREVALLARSMKTVFERVTGGVGVRWGSMGYRLRRLDWGDGGGWVGEQGNTY